MKIYWNGERKNVIGSRVKQLRKKQDISQKILAARLSLSGIDFEYSAALEPPNPL